VANTERNAAFTAGAQVQPVEMALDGLDRQEGTTLGTCTGAESLRRSAQWRACSAVTRSRLRWINERDRYR